MFAKVSTKRVALLLAAAIVSSLAAVLPARAHTSIATVRSWGGNASGQFGNGTTAGGETPMPASGIAGAVDVEAGDGFTLALLADGTVWSWGGNTFGQLGTGTFTPTSTPVRVGSLIGITAISAGRAHALALQNDGSVWAWGRNDSGQVGDGTTLHRAAPVRVITGGATAVSAGSFHSTAVRSSTAVTWGENGSGQLGSGNTIDRLAPGAGIVFASPVTGVAAGGDHTSAVLANGTVWAWGAAPAGLGTFSPGQVSGFSKLIAQLSAGDAHVLALASDGTLFAWGSNSAAQLGTGGGSSTVAAVVRNIASVVRFSAGGGTSLAVRSDGVVYGWGFNLSEQAGQPSEHAPVAVGLPAAVEYAPDTDLTVDDSASPDAPFGGIVDVDAGITHSTAATGPGALLSTTSVAFSPQPLGTRSGSLGVTFRNIRGAPTSIEAARIGGADGEDFVKTTDTCSGATVGPGGACFVNVAFAPTARGARNATLTFASDATIGNVAATLAGTGTQPVASLTPSAPISFGSVVVGSSSTASTLTLTNTGDAPLHVGSAALGGAAPQDFAFTADTCSRATVAPGSACTLGVKLAPLSRGAKSANVLIPHDGAGGLTSLTVSGTGTQAVATPSAKAISFGELMIGGGTTTRVLSVTNTGDAPLPIGYAFLEGASSGDFARQTDSCSGTTVAAGAKCDIVVSFTARSVGERTSTLIIPTGAGTLDVAVAGTGVDRRAPASTFVTRNSSILVHGANVIRGSSTDDAAGVASVAVRLTDALGNARFAPASTTGCIAGRITCQWEVALPLVAPGVYTAQAVASDASGNVESTGPTIQVVIL